MEPGETMEATLQREIMEELGKELLVTDVKPWFFRDGIRIKTYPDGTTK